MQGSISQGLESQENEEKSGVRRSIEENGGGRGEYTDHPLVAILCLWLIYPRRSQSGQSVSPRGRERWN